MVQNLHHLLKYRNYFEGDDVVRAYYQSNLLYLKELAKGLDQVADRYEFVRTYRSKTTLEETFIRYLASMLDYPVVKVRELTMQSVFDLVVGQPGLIRTFVSFGLDPNCDNKTEWALVVLHAIALHDSSLLVAVKEPLLEQLDSGHFNIVQSAADILRTIDKNSPSFLVRAEQQKVEAANTQSALIIPLPNVLLSDAEIVLVSRFQEDLLQAISYEDNSDDAETSVYDRVNADLYARGYPDDAEQRDLEVQRSYNINTNFDAIEIYSEYYDMAKSSLNRVFYDMVRCGSFERAFIDIIKYKFRVYDPSKLLYRAVARPEYINWVPDKVSEADFASFNDLDGLLEDFINRQEDYITLAEYGMQRHSRGHKQLHATVYFEILALTRKKGAKELSDISSKKLISAFNLYAHEIFEDFGDHAKFLPAGWYQPVNVSINRFRGIDDLINAGPTTDFQKGLGIGSWNLLNAMTMDHLLINAFRWQDKYATSSDRWRYEPSSKGFTMRIAKQQLTDYLAKNDLELCYIIKLKQSDTQYQPDYLMDWQFKSKVFTDVLNNRRQYKG